MTDNRYLYSDTAENYDKIARISGYDRVPPRLVCVFQEAAGFQPGMKVLDFGCGTGKLTQAIFDAGVPVKVTGMEPCRGMADQFMVRFKDNAHVALNRGGYDRYLPMPDESFDAVLAAGVFDHIRITPHVMREFMRVVKPQGFFAFTYERRSELFLSKQRYSAMAQTYSHKDSYVKTCLEEAGAEIVKHQRMFGYFYFHLSRMGLFVAQKPG